MAFSTQLQGVATELIRKFGARVKIIKADGNSVTTTGVRFEVKREGQTISEQSCFYISGAVSKQVDVGDIIQVGTATYRVSEVEVSNPAGTPIYYKCLVQ